MSRRPIKSFTGLKKFGSTVDAFRDAASSFLPVDAGPASRFDGPVLACRRTIEVASRAGPAASRFDGLVRACRRTIEGVSRAGPAAEMRHPLFRLTASGEPRWGPRVGTVRPQPAEREASDADANQPTDTVPHLGEQPPDLPITTFAQGDFDNAPR